MAQVTTLGILLHRRHVRLPLAPLLHSAGKHLLACLPMLGLAWFTLTQLTASPLLLRVPAAILAAAAAYAAATLLLRCRELREFRHQ